MKEKRGAAMGITVLAAVLAFLVVAGVLYYNKVYKPSVQQAVQETTSYKAGGTEPQKAGKRTLVAKNSTVSVYVDGDFVIIDNDGAEEEFSDWNENFGKYDTQVYYADFNSDGSKDIIIVDDEGEGDIKSKRLYGLYVLTLKNEKSENTYKVSYTNSDNWLSNFNSIVTCSLNQLKIDPQIIQFVMDYNGVSVPLDADTGLAPEGTRAWYTETAKTENGENAKLKSVRLSDAYITYDEKTNSAEAQIYVYATYDGAAEQNVGIITTGIEIYNGNLDIKEKSVVYSANEDLAVAAPKR
jgi:hypothetical protein